MVLCEAFILAGIPGHESHSGIKIRSESATILLVSDLLEVFWGSLLRLPATRPPANNCSTKAVDVHS